jgi:AraC-like DNA-binding protein/mannose-6-phosphate isomerase-like protein (cupin superfamily)
LRGKEVVVAMDKARFHYDNIFNLSPLAYGNFIVHQIGDLSCGYRHEVPQHHQYCYEISLILSGEADFLINDALYRVKSGDLILNRPEDWHTIESDDASPVRYVYMGFNFNEPLEECASLREQLDGVTDRRTMDRMDMGGLFFSIFNELKAGESYGLMLIAGYVNEIVVKTQRNFTGGRDKRTYAPEIPGITADNTIYAIINMLDSQNLRLDHFSEIGRQFGYSYAYLSQLFTKRVDMTISEYFHMRLFDRAVALLKQGLSVTEIADKLGYHSIHSFSRAFTKYFGMSPSVYLTQEKAAQGSEKADGG